MSEQKKVKVWDIAVRIFHWSLVAALFILYFVVDEESRKHIQVGYVIIGLVVFRFVWGFIGSKHARFSDFIRGPSTIARYTRSLVEGKPKYSRGHNPLAGVMAVALLVSVFITAWSGLEIYGAEGRGPLAYGSPLSLSQTLSITSALADDDDERGEGGERGEFGERGERGEAGEHYWERIHGQFADITWYFIYIHIIGAIVTSVLNKENLVRSMVAGYKLKRAEE